ncbi:MAG: SDR family NAD(P)-dependent oxidoreductase [Fibrobacterota bacterium]
MKILNRPQGFLSPAQAGLLKLSQEFGKDPSLVIAGGGNTSAKEGDFLHVKASGTPLACPAFVKMELRKILAIFETALPGRSHERESHVSRLLLEARVAGEENLRPSVEALLHALLPQKFVAHIHPTLVNGLTCSKNGFAAFNRLFSRTMLWVPYTNPGYTLALRVREAVLKHGKVRADRPLIIFLDNHGLIIAAPTPASLTSALNGLLAQLRARMRRRMPDFTPAVTDRDRAAAIAPALRAMLAEGDEWPTVVYDAPQETMQYLKSSKAFRPVSSVFTPDHSVYCQSAPLFVPKKKDIEAQYAALATAIAAFRKKHKVSPAVVAVQDLGIFAIGKTRNAADTVLALFRDTVSIALFARAFGGSRFMRPANIAFICGWEAERYRRGMAAAGKAGTSLRGKVAVVTGGAQGFGQGLAEALVHEGAETVIADMNEALAQKSAETLCNAYGKGRAYALAANVADEASVKNMIRETVLAYGGLDIFVSNAGVLKAGSLNELSTADFEKVTRVNYLGFFLCAKYASAVMKLQHRFAQDRYMDIIQINSKSGLSGSKNNSAYAGGKFGGIGLTQSFALELVDDNIKVNALCPGNLFDGPLWSDPVNGLFAQYLRAKKVPGARTIADVRSFYESKVPMKRGCTVADAARAMLYLIAQEYETGQALPVTGGQNMLK